MVFASVDEDGGCGVGFAVLAGWVMDGLRGGGETVVEGVSGLGLGVAGCWDGTLGVRHFDFVEGGTGNQKD